MRLITLLAVILAVTAIRPLLAQQAMEAAPALSLQKRIISVYNENKGAVVKVISAINAENGASKNVLLVGTGFYISKEGHILTNTNVVYGASRIWIERDGIAYVCEPVGHDPLTNVSIIRALELPSDFQFLRFSESPNLPPIGSFLLGITCELGMSPGPALGMVSGWNTQYVERILPTVYLRSDIPYDGGEGGSPIFDLNGSLIGMVVAALPEIRSSLILPARAIQRVRDDILFSGKVTYAYFGFQARQTSNLASGPWVEIERVTEDSPAALAGIQPGDILKQMGTLQIRTDDDLRSASFFIRPNEYTPVQIIRGDEELEVEMKPTVREIPISAMPPVSVQNPSTDNEPSPVSSLPNLESTQEDSGAATENQPQASVETDSSESVTTSQE